MYFLLAAAAAASIAVLLVHAAATAKVRSVRASPDKYPLDDLCRDPQGEEVYVDRPDGTRIRAIHRGEGPTVVLAHGYGVSLASLTVLFDSLVASGFRVIAFDLRGLGKSTIGSDGVGSAAMAGDYAAVLERFDARDAVLLGHSMGGFLGVVFAIQHAEAARERLRGLVLIGALAGDLFRGSPQNRVQIPLIRYGVMTRIVRTDVYGALFGISLMGDRPFSAAAEAVRRLFLAEDHGPMLPISLALGRESYYGRLGEVPVPAVVICGEKDRTAPSWHSRSLGAGIPGSRNVWLPGTGHLVPWEATDVVVEAVRSLQAEPVRAVGPVPA